MDYYNAPRVVQRSYGGSTSYMRFVIPGWILITIGLLCIIIGFVDIGWTASKYGTDCTYTASSFFDPCDANHVYTYVSSSVWGGIIIMACGFACLMMTPKRLSFGTGLIYYVYVGLAMLVILLAAPAIVVLNALEIVLNDETFYNSDTRGSLATIDDTKFALPIVIAILGAIAFFVALMAALIGCFCRPHGGGYGRGIIAEPIEYVDRSVVLPAHRPAILQAPRPAILQAPRPAILQAPREKIYVVEEPIYEPRHEPIYEPRHESRYEPRHEPRYETRHEPRPVLRYEQPRTVSRSVSRSCRPRRQIIMVDEPSYERSQVIERVVERPHKNHSYEYDDDNNYGGYGDYGSRFGSVYSEGSVYRPSRAIKY